MPAFISRMSGETTFLGVCAMRVDDRHRTRSLVPSGLTLLCIFLFALNIPRLWFGVDTADESYYFAIPLRFILGDKPFLDDIELHQISTFFYIPFLKLLHFLNGNLEGVILYMRGIFLLTAGLTAIVVFRCMRAVDDQAPLVSALLSMICVFYVLGGLPALCYNTFVIFGLTTSLFLVFARNSGTLRHPTLAVISAGVLMAIVVLAYPPTIPSVGIIGLLIVFRRRRWNWGGLLPFLAGFGTPVVVFLAYLLYLGLPDVLHSLSFGFDGPQLGGKEKLLLVLNGFWHSFPIPLWTFLYLTIAAVSYRLFSNKYPILLWLVVPLIFWPLIQVDFHESSAADRYLIFFALLGPYLLVFTPKEDLLPKRILVHLWTPAFCAGILTAWASANGYINFSIGFFPATIATGWIFSRSLKALPFPRGDRISQAPLFVPISLLGLLLYFNYSFIYGDGKIGALTARMETGPFKGLMTQPEKKSFLTLLDGSIRKYRTDGRILFYDHLPAGYLMTNSRPASNAVWQWKSSPGFPDSNRNAVMEYLQVPEHRPRVVFRTKKVPNVFGGWITLDYEPTDPLDQWIRTRYRKVEENEWYTVFTSDGAS